MQSTPLLTLTNLQLRFGAGPRVLCGISLRLGQGEHLGLLGRSGSGKSLTAAALLGLLPPTADITAGRADYTRADGSTVDLLAATDPQLRDIRGAEIGLIFQEPLTALNPTMRVGRQLQESIKLLRPDLTTRAARETCLLDWLSKVELGEEAERVRRAYPHQLSGGQRQRILIAMALLPLPRLLIADEPTTALDALTQDTILTLIQKLTAEFGISLLFITHDRAVMRRMVGRVIELENGEVLREGPTVEILPPARTGRPASAQPVASIKPVLRVNDLHVSYVARRRGVFGEGRTYAAVKGVSFELRPGEFVALIGPSGCGKTSVARTLVGLETASSGSVESTGKVQLIPQDPAASLPPHLKVGAILGEVLRLRAAYRGGVLGRLNAAGKNRVGQLLAEVGLDPEVVRQRLPHQLSGGQRQRVAIARALAADPAVLVADESVSALDEELQTSVLQLLNTLRRDKGIALLLITHDLLVAAGHAGRVLLMEAGELIERGPTREILKNPKSELGRRLAAMW